MKVKYTVIKPFKTVNRRFEKEGAELVPEDIHPENVLSLEDYIAGGFVLQEEVAEEEPVLPAHEEEAVH